MFLEIGSYIYIINIIFAAIVLFFERKRPVYTLLWIVILLLTSYVGFIAYLFFGLKFYKKRQVNKFYKRTFLKEIYTHNNYKIRLVEKRKELVNYIIKTVGNKVTYCNTVLFYKDGDKFFKNLMKDIKEAKENINIEFYIFNDDKFGKTFYDELEKKSKEGIKVRIIIDGVGTKKLKRSRRKSLKESGVDLKIFFPSHFPILTFGTLRANYRNHRKLCVIDSLILYTGGFNIGSEYIGDSKFGYWRDTGCRIKGEVSVDADREFYISWNFLHKEPLDFKEIDKNLRKKINEMSSNIRDYDINALQLISSGPNYQTRTIRDSFISMITNAKRSIYIETPYFVPDDLILDCLKIAITSGIEVKIIIPSFGDHLFVYWANQASVIELIEIGAEVYKYEKGFFHSKLIIIDNEIAAIGSANFDYRSFYQNFEINVNVYDVELIGYLRQLFYEDLHESFIINKEDISNRKTSEKFKEAIIKLISPII
ncbi:cardiolipin synthase [Fusobacterium sp. MFO224]|uniref:cardiolipin synthase n=1 Tax=Fusobacterium sp. MFO224 TaxID=3378070 RepID=UPI003852DF05